MGFTDRVPDTPAPSRLVGRTDEVAQAREALARGRSGRGGLLVITGEAGIGKTRLLAEGLAGADEDGVLRGQCVPGGSSLRPISEALLGTWRGRPFPPGDSLRVFRGPLSRLVPGWATDAGTTSSAEDPMVLAEGMLELLQAAYPHPVLVLEDLHWADAATLALLDHLTPGLRATPVTVVATARTDEPGSEELQRLLDHPLVDLLTLARLPGQQTADLVRQRAGAPVPQDAVDLVVEASAGLPLLAEELFAGLVEGRSLVAGAHGWERTDLLVTRVPPSLVGLVTTRLARLAPADVAVVAAAAVSGDAGDWRLLVEATGQDGADVLAALRAAATGHLLTADGPALAWRHALTREAVLASLLAPDVDVARERVAAALAARSDDASAARAADLWAEAGDLGRAASTWRALARRHERAGNLAEADRLLSCAVARGGSDQVAGDRVRVLTLSGQVRAALDVGTAALPLVTGEAHARLCLELAAAAVEAADWPQALAYVERSGRPDDPRARVASGDALFGSGDLDRARVVASEVVAESDATGGVDPPTLCSALEIVGRCDRASDAAAARASFARAAQVAAEHGLLTRRVRALHSLGSLELMRSQSAPSLDEARRTAEEIGMLATVAAVDLMRGDVELLVRGPAAGAVHAEAAARLSSRLGMEELSATAALLRDLCLAWGGADPESLPTLWADASSGPPDRRGHVAVLRAIPAFLAHDPEQATDLLDEAVSVFAAHSAGAPLPTWGLWALLRTAVDRDGAGARAVVRGSQAGLRGANEAAVLLAEAVEAGRAGRPKDAADLKRRAERELRDAPWWSRVLSVPVHQAALTDGWGDPVNGLRADLRAFETGEDRELARICRDLLRSAGVTVRRGRGDNAVPPHLGARGVTSREMDVLLLVAAGASNADAANRLHLSPRTVEHHVARLLVKLGASNRTELSPWLDAEP